MHPHTRGPREEAEGGIASERANAAIFPEYGKFIAFDSMIY